MGCYSCNSFSIGWNKCGATKLVNTKVESLLFGTLGINGSYNTIVTFEAKDQVDVASYNPIVLCQKSADREYAVVGQEIG